MSSAIETLCLSPQDFRFHPLDDKAWEALRERHQLPPHLRHCIGDLDSEGRTPVYHSADVRLGEVFASIAEALALPASARPVPTPANGAASQGLAGDEHEISAASLHDITAQRTPEGRLAWTLETVEQIAEARGENAERVEELIDELIAAVQLWRSQQQGVTTAFPRPMSHGQS
jgi:hypothetical protein